MLYSDLVKFEKIIDIIQIKQADDRTKAENLVKTYVVSPRMAENVAESIFFNLQFQEPLNNKGIFIVGNYGTGKSHLMSVISVIAEDETMVNHINSDYIKQKSSSVAGRFKVIRDEIGSTKINLRDFICDILVRKLASMGIKFEFPPYDEIKNHKDLFVDLMGKFQEKYPDKGLLLVIDELLDYLGSRNAQELILDLSFLREIGEICSITRFRFIAGVQESLFDSPRFQFAAESIRRVKDRFHQMRIVREDIEHVIAERLLKKDDKQKEQIEQHLKKFTRYFENLSERMKTFVSLFPIHPSFLETFEKVYIAEKRVMLKTLSDEMEAIMNKPVPNDSPGVISYDFYWKYIMKEPSLRSIPEVREIIDKSSVLQQKIEQSFPKYKKDSKPVADRIINALSVHRLSTGGDISAKIGLTSENLRDELFLLLPIPDPSADFLKTTIESVLKEILNTVNRQFISQNPQNGQYYLDLKKDIDFDALIEQKAGTLSSDTLNRYYFGLLRRLMEVSDTTYITGFNIWEYDLEWINHRIDRRGYLFFGAPNQRSTTQPPRDFYIYFMEIYTDKKYKLKEAKEDEVFLFLAINGEFEENLKRFASAMELHLTSSQVYKNVYAEKSDTYRKTLTRWLSENLLTVFSAFYNGKNRNLSQWLQEGNYKDASSFKDVIDSVSSICLKPHFQDKYPEYPIFSERITYSTISSAAQESVSAMSGGLKSKQGIRILNSFNLLDNFNKLDIKNSKYARYFIDLMDKRGRGQVINRREIIDETDPRIETDLNFKLEPEWIGVILTALVHSGYIILTLEDGEKLDASDLTGMKSLRIDKIKKFKYFQRPKELPLPELTVLFKLLDIPEGLIRQENQREEGVRQMIVHSDKLLRESIIPTINKLEKGIFCWGENLLTPGNTQRMISELAQVKEFLESLARFNTPARLKNFNYDTRHIESMNPPLHLVKKIKDLEDMANWASSFVSYLSPAGDKLPDKNPLKEKIEDARLQFIQDISQEGTFELIQKKWIPVLRDLKNEYITLYLEIHRKHRLDHLQDDRKKKILNGETFKSLQEMAKIEMMDRASFYKLRNSIIDGIKPCYSLTQKDMENNYICPHCRLNPLEIRDSREVSLILEDMERQSEQMFDNWQENLYNNLSDPFVQDSIDLLEEDEKKIIKNFIKNKKLPSSIDSDFVGAVSRALKGLEKVEISLDEIKKALTTKGNISNPTDIQKRFENFINTKTKGKDKDRIRIILS